MSSMVQPFTLPRIRILKGAVCLDSCGSGDAILDEQGGHELP